ncbi:MAG: mandelate racemase/muconate lactonizing enzyme family protein, partial [Anaerolineales bacterium]
MKITSLTAESYRFLQQRPIRTGDGTFGVTRMSLIRVATDAGLTGISWLYASRLAAHEKIIPQLVESFQPMLQGRDPCDTEAIWAALHGATAAGEHGLIASIIGAIDIALWDVKGQAANLPLYKLLGGYAGRIPAYVAGGYYEVGKDLRELAQEMESYVALGARAVKMKIGGAPVKEDVERVRAVRNAVGPDVKVMVDSNLAHQTYEAIQFARQIEPLDIFWYEEPVAGDDLRGLAAVAATTTIPIASGENEYTPAGFRALMEANAVRIITPDAQHTGVTGFLKAAALAQAHNLPIATHGSQDIHVHLACAVPNCLTVEYYRDNSDPMWGHFLKEHVQIE